MKHFPTFCLAFLLFTVIGCKRERTFQYTPVEVDTAAIADSIERSRGGLSDFEPMIADDEGVYEIPDIPEDDPIIDMSSNDYDVKRVMMGKE